jgi:hypothetical protein
LFEHDLVGKSLHTFQDHAFQDHALAAGWRIATIGPQDNMHYDALWNASQNLEPPAMDRASRFD